MPPDPQPGGQPDAPVQPFYLAIVYAARRSPWSLGLMAFSVRRFLFAPVGGGANAGRASVTSGGFVATPLAVLDHGASGNGANTDRAPSSRLDFAALPLLFAGRSACGNGAVRELTANFVSPRFPRNVSLRCADIERAIMKDRAYVSATRGVCCQCEVAVGRVASARFGWGVRGVPL